MNKLVAAYVIIFILFAYFSSIAEGGGGVVATSLNEALTATDTTIAAVDTTDFLASGSFVVEDEEIAYTSENGTHFIGCTRGFRGTTPATHDLYDTIYTPETGVLNRALGFDVVSTNEAYGTLSVIAVTWTFLTKSMGYLITFNFGILGGQLVYLRYMLLAPAVGFVVYMGFMAMGTAFGIINR